MTEVGVDNMVGQEVLVQKSTSITSLLDMSFLLNEIYIVRLSADNQVNTIKVAKE